MCNSLLTCVAYDDDNVQFVPGDVREYHPEAETHLSCGALGSAAYQLFLTRNDYDDEIPF